MSRAKNQQGIDIMVCGREKLDRAMRRKEPAFNGRMVVHRKGSRLGTVTEAEAQQIQEIARSGTEVEYRSPLVDVDLLMDMLVGKSS